MEYKDIMYAVMGNESGTLFYISDNWLKAVEKYNMLNDHDKYCILELTDPIEMPSKDGAAFGFNGARYLKGSPEVADYFVNG